jgi:Cdc6-like AAA superfamily ATPase
MSDSTTLSINRYCAVADGDCPESNIKFRGNRSCFLAYPFTSAYMESMECLCQSLLDEHNIHATLPTDVLEGGVIFCKLCKEIYANNFVLSEVTDLNRNVIFEHGYAIAVGRQGLLLRNRTRISQEFSLLKDVEQVYYENRGDIMGHVAKFEIDDRDPAGRSPRLIGMCQTCDIEERYNLIYFLKNGSRSDAVRTIDKYLRKQSLFEIIDDNPNDVAGHEVHQYCKRIQQARYVVAHFVSDRQKEHQTLNARVAFLMGLAMGFGKRVLILQERPIGKKMIDLKGVIREYDRESVARLIVQEWLDKQRDYVTSFEKIREKAKQKRRRRIVTLRDLDLGPVAAEKDLDLPKYFVETPYYRRAQRGDKTLFLGRRGSGKTALFRILSNELKSPNNVVAQVAPRDYELLKLEGFLAEKFSTAHWRFVYGSIWRNVLLTEVVQATIEQHPPYLPPSEPLAQLVSFRDENEDLFQRSFTDRLTYTIEQLQTLHSHSQTSKNQEQVEQILKSIRFHEIEKLIKELVQEKRAYVLIDHLDENWSTENEQTCLLLAALIHEADRLNTYLTPGLRITVFLRSDIFDVVRLMDLEIDKRAKDFIQWNKALLTEVVASRIANTKGLSLADRAPEEVWYSVFCDHVDSEDTISYIISRTLLRPRDILQFCNRCLEEAQNQRHDYVQEDDILRAERDYSEDKILDLYREYRISHPDLIELLWLFKELPEEIEELKISGIIEEARNKPETLKEASKWVSDRSTDQLIRFLYDIGFLGVKSSDGRFVYSYDRSLEKATFDGLQMVPYEKTEQVAFALRDIWDWFKQCLGIKRQVSKEQRVFSVHPAFRKHLRII